MPPPVRPPARSARPLLVTRDVALLDDVVRVAATVGLELDVCADAGSARDAWPVAPAVLVGQDAAPGLVAAGLPRRAEVTLFGGDPDDVEVWERAVRLGVAQVMFLPEAEEWLAELFADLVEGRPDLAPLVAVVGGRGGAGATTLAVGLAVTAASQRRRVVVVDADPLGGGIDLVVGAEDATGLRWPDLAGTSGRVSSRALLDALPTAGGLTVLSWGRGNALSVPPAAMDAVLPAAQRGADLVVVDLPRRLDEAASRAAARAALVLLVVPAEVRAASAAARVAAGLASHCADLRLVVRGPAPGHLTADFVAESVGLPLAGVLRPEPGLAGALERGEPPAARGRGPLFGLSSALLAELPLPPRSAAA